MPVPSGTTCRTNRSEQRRILVVPASFEVSPPAGPVPSSRPAAKLDQSTWSAPEHPSSRLELPPSTRSRTYRLHGREQSSRRRRTEATASSPARSLPHMFELSAPLARTFRRVWLCSVDRVVVVHLPRDLRGRETRTVGSAPENSCGLVDAEPKSRREHAFGLVHLVVLVPRQLIGIQGIHRWAFRRGNSGYEAAGGGVSTDSDLSTMTHPFPSVHARRTDHVGACALGGARPGLPRVGVAKRARRGPRAVARGGSSSPAGGLAARAASTERGTRVQGAGEYRRRFRAPRVVCPAARCGSRPR
jgi:hypothetical protein